MVYQTAQHDNPTRAEAVGRTMAGSVATPGVTPPRRRPAARRDPLVAVLESMRPDEHLADARDAEPLLIEWTAARRADGLARLHVDDLHVTERGYRCTCLGRRPTKPAKAPPSVSPPHQHSTVGGRTEAANSAVGCRGGVGALIDVPAWRGVDRYGRRPRSGGLHRNSVAEIIKRRAAAAGLTTPHCGAGTACRGFATEAIAAGVPERNVQRHGRWRFRALHGALHRRRGHHRPHRPTHWLC